LALDVQSRHADGGIRFVDGTVGSNPRIPFRHPAAVAEAGLAAVAGAGVNLRQLDHSLLPSSLHAEREACHNRTQARVRLQNRCTFLRQDPAMRTVPPFGRETATWARKRATDAGCDACRGCWPRWRY